MVFSTPVATTPTAYGTTGIAPVSKWTPAATAGRQLTLPDLLSWKGIRNPALSNDGKLFAYIITPQEGDAEVVVRGTAADAKETRFPIGDPTVANAAASAAGRGGAPGGAKPALQISGNGRWVAFMEYGSSANAGRGERGGRGGVGAPAAAAPAAGEEAQSKLAIVDATTGVKQEFESVRSYRFAGEKSNWVAIQHNAPAAAANELKQLEKSTHPDAFDLALFERDTRSLYGRL